MSVRVTVRDEQTGETHTARVADGDYILICVAPCWRSSVQVHGAGQRTHVITVKDRAPKPLPPEPTR